MTRFTLLVSLAILVLIPLTSQAVETLSYAPESVFATEYGDFAFQVTMVAGDAAGPFAGFQWHGVDNVSESYFQAGDCDAEPLLPGSVMQFTVSGSLDSLFEGGSVASAAWDCTQPEGLENITVISFETVEAQEVSWSLIKTLFR